MGGPDVNSMAKQKEQADKANKPAATGLGWPFSSDHERKLDAVKYFPMGSFAPCTVAVEIMPRQARERRKCK
jgi:hypothetical protein